MEYARLRGWPCDFFFFQLVLLFGSGSQTYVASSGPHNYAFSAQLRELRCPRPTSNLNHPCTKLDAQRNEPLSLSLMLRSFFRDGVPLWRGGWAFAERWGNCMWKLIFMFLGSATLRQPRRCQDTSDPKTFLDFCSSRRSSYAHNIWVGTHTYPHLMLIQVKNTFRTRAWYPSIHLSPHRTFSRRPTRGNESAWLVLYRTSARVSAMTRLLLTKNSMWNNFRFSNFELNIISWCRGS